MLVQPRPIFFTTKENAADKTAIYLGAAGIIGFLWTVDLGV